MNTRNTPPLTVHGLKFISCKQGFTKADNQLYKNNLEAHTKHDKILYIAKGIAILLIVLAHIGLDYNGLIYHIRCFDVPLLVFISGKAYGNHKEIKIHKLLSRDSWYIKRVKRLVIPVWFLLSIYLLLYICFNLPWFSDSIINSYCLMSEYVWIYRIFLYLMIVTPFIVNYKRSISIVTLLLLVLVYFIMTIAYDDFSEVLYKQICFFGGYLIIFTFGVMYDYFNKKVVTIFHSVILIYFISKSLMEGHIPYMSFYKYPPTYPFICYGILCSYGLFYILNKKDGFFGSNILAWLGRHMDWIYLWHILFLMLYKDYFNRILYYTIVLMSSILVCFIQNQLVCKIIPKNRMTKTLYNYLK